LALQQYDANEHPRDLARQYDKSQRPVAGTCAGQEALEVTAGY